MPQSDIFTSLRAALETTRGTPVDPTRILENTEFSHTPDVATIRPSERRGSYFAFYRTAAGREHHEVSFSGLLSYQQAVWLGNTFIKGVTTGVGGGADKTYAFLPASATDDIKSATLEWGYDTALSATQPGFRLPFVVGDELTLTFDKSSADGVTFSANMHSPKAVTQITAFGGTPAALVTQAITPTTVQVFIDSATIGTTADNYITNAEFTLTNEWTDLDTLNLTTAAQDTFRVGARAWTLSCQRYKINDTELDAYNAKTARKVRIRATGPSLGGSTYMLTLDCYGVWSGYSNDSVDGLAMETLTLEPLYDTTAGTDFSLTVVSNDTTIT
jgi:hypothetical protein